MESRGRVFFLFNKGEYFMKTNGIELEKEILDQLPAIVIAVDKNFNVIYANNAALNFMGSTPEKIIGQHCYNAIRNPQCNTPECCIAQAMADGKVHTIRSEADGGTGNRFLESTAVPLKDEKGEIVGGLEFVLDITQKVLDEKKLNEQGRTIRDMSTPTIKLWDGILVLPVVGVIDTNRAQHMMDSMLNKILASNSRAIIMDIQGVAAVDTAVANHLIKITKATKLMGCECLISGISPGVAKTLTQLGINLGSIKTKATLSDALEEAFSMINLRVVTTEAKQ
jgi:rsbT co-antagonist protein RsbR